VASSDTSEENVAKEAAIDSLDERLLERAFTMKMQCRHLMPFVLMIGCFGEATLAPSDPNPSPNDGLALTLAGTACEIEGLTIETTPEGIPQGPGECVTMSRGKGERFPYVVECDDGERKYRFAGSGGRVSLETSVAVEVTVTPTSAPASDCGGLYTGTYSPREF
jgi:hypothetical protein